MDKMKRWKLAAGTAIATSFITTVYATQAWSKLQRASGGKVCLSDCRFEAYFEREGSGLPFPMVDCHMKTAGGSRTLAWSAASNAWQDVTPAESQRPERGRKSEPAPLRPQPERLRLAGAPSH